MSDDRPKVVNPCGCGSCHADDIYLAAIGVRIDPPKPPPPAVDIGKPVENPVKVKSLFSECE